MSGGESFSSRAKWDSVIDNVAPDELFRVNNFFPLFSISLSKDSRSAKDEPLFRVCIPQSKILGNL